MSNRNLYGDFSHMIGKRVCKSSGKPFKSGSKTNTVKSVVVGGLNPNHPDIECFTFEEDDSIVESWRCEIVSADYQSYLIDPFSFLTANFLSDKMPPT